jgi:hypothetical protein
VRVSDEFILLGSGVSVLVAILGATATSYRRASEHSRNVSSHLAAWIIFAAGAVEILSDVFRV